MKFKFKESEELVEVFFTPHNLDRHYERHVLGTEDGIWKMEYMPKEEYNRLADELSSARASTIDDENAVIIGYVAESGRIIKHNKNSLLTVAYVDDDINGHEAISLYKQPTHKLLRKARMENKPYTYAKDID